MGPKKPLTVSNKGEQLSFSVSAVDDICDICDHMTGVQESLSYMLQSCETLIEDLKEPDEELKDFMKRLKFIQAEFDSVVVKKMPSYMHSVQHMEEFDVDEWDDADMEYYMHMDQHRHPFAQPGFNVEED